MRRWQREPRTTKAEQLHWAALNGNVEAAAPAVQALVAAGAAVGGTRNDDAEPRHRAAANSKPAAATAAA